ncbi:hypothetical protein J7F01_36810 [Streptomyces sp. ISL-22]|uniref:hypothetical protein n=1 Tax=unclassified Streptomyces TaxID=2593676 RepID=UPI001BE6DC55|nr:MULTISPECIES: hypothetical protein [unclassified Streptomyces]MBT2420758.1 hypothetical protein [Streptomyces sp. ISL-24]MBT2437612.1 hypothetical protein [Streptomyces sp. ISL-22]
MTGFEIAKVIAVGGYVVGGAYDRLKKLVDERGERRRRAADGPEPICGCRHHLIEWRSVLQGPEKTLGWLASRGH